MAPKDRRDAAWNHCQLDDNGKKNMQLLWEENCWGGIHRIKQHLAHARGNVEPCPKVSNDLRAEMLGNIEAFQEEKSKAKKLQKDIGRSFMLAEFDSDYEGDDHDTP